MPTQCFPVRGQSVIDLILEGREKVSVRGPRFEVGSERDGRGNGPSLRQQEPPKRSTRKWRQSPARRRDTFCPLHCRYV